ncbi:hypothetical protein SBOR_6921 [Sclerotinia borealis F-4128]|uniref:Uncharacterized protein n=1 Tax=Sclerotinia borealis (strain F-4128) TaxID=1432307 RepID=W9CD10_SCLBF|nr:hypothetical protein SBOR_6921 [Sclerotinia borealis F-4128]
MSSFQFSQIFTEKVQGAQKLNEIKKKYDFSTLKYLHDASLPKQDLDLLMNWKLIRIEFPGFFERYNLHHLIQPSDHSKSRESTLDGLLRYTLNSIQFVDLVMASLGYTRLSIQRAIDEVVHIADVFTRASPSDYQYITGSDQHPLTQYVILSIMKRLAHTVEDFFHTLLEPFYKIYLETPSSRASSSALGFSSPYLLYSEHVVPLEGFDVLSVLKEFASLAAIPSGGEATSMTIQRLFSSITTSELSNGHSSRVEMNHNFSSTSPPPEHKGDAIPKNISINHTQFPSTIEGSLQGVKVIRCVACHRRYMRRHLKSHMRVEHPQQRFGVGGWTIEEDFVRYFKNNLKLGLEYLPLVHSQLKFLWRNQKHQASMYRNTSSESLINLHPRSTLRWSWVLPHHIKIASKAINEA